MTQEEKNTLISQASKYNAEKLLYAAAQMLAVNKKANIEIEECSWIISEVTEVLLFKFYYKYDGNEVELNIIEDVFKLPTRQADKTIGIKPEMSMENKIKIRLAYVIYMHRND